ncbi:polyprenyl synthetase family protein [Sediminitomix flava]|uniref:Geranylgeranyl diphosphate synthase type II n=1 Tax=Sediminitomix flava TaxID=379075 RepID=A0A315ZAJ8_SEDFL|nr:polyprenyl synthetase family protein [Sediminitomix flava]PWJ41110.1 geranylgeranyl diphosphate synthase type II [Sediminitomix flava]
MFEIKSEINRLNEEIAKLELGNRPAELYDPLYYILSLGGKRLRPLVALLGCYAFDDDYKKATMPALAVEIFHNFSLIHDDIMDNAPLRRGKATVHEKWNPNIAILSGDVMLVRAYDLLLESPSDKLKEIIKLFNTCAAEVCEGQQLDMNFEDRETVSEAEYIEMIKLKTAVLVGFAFELGALIGNATEQEAKTLRDFGVNLGIGFQLQDDLLDVFGEQAKVGKQIGGDILENKKTYMLLKAIELAEGKDKEDLQFWLEQKEYDKDEKVKAVTAIYENLGIRQLAGQKMEEYYQLAFQKLDELNLPSEKRELIISFANWLIKRDK